MALLADNAANASLKDIDAILALKVHLAATYDTIVVIYWWMIHMVTLAPERDKLVKWMRALMSVVTAEWTTFRGKELSDSYKRDMTGVHLITRVSY